MERSSTSRRSPRFSPPSVSGSSWSSPLARPGLLRGSRSGSRRRLRCFPWNSERCCCYCRCFSCFFRRRLLNYEHHYWYYWKWKWQQLQGLLQRRSLPKGDSDTSEWCLCLMLQKEAYRCVVQEKSVRSPAISVSPLQNDCCRFYLDEDDSADDSSLLLVLLSLD